jgi:hypothetical protein
LLFLGIQRADSRKLDKGLEDGNMITSYENQLSRVKLLIKKSPTVSKILNLIIKVAVILVERLLKRSLIKAEEGKKISVVKIEGYRNIFCGYYDVSPFCPQNSNLLLIHATNHSVYSLPQISTPIDLLLYDISSGFWKIIDKTRTWNWQQGSRLQWLDDQRVIYNTLYEGQIRCKIKDIVNNEEEILPINLSIAYKDKFIFSIDYIALTNGSEYGYPGFKSDIFDHHVYVYDLMENAYSKLFSWDELYFLTLAGSEKLHINHILPSPDCSGFVFIFRYWLKGRRYDSLLYFHMASKEFRIIIKNQVVSHYTWRDNNRLWAWVDVDGDPGYYMINIDTMRLDLLLPIGDGHPSHITGDKYISDLYTGSRFSGHRFTAFSVDTSTGSMDDLVTLSHPTLFNHANRCDMHISLSDDKRRYQLDSRHIDLERTVVVGELG